MSLKSLATSQRYGITLVSTGTIGHTPPRKRLPDDAPNRCPDCGRERIPGEVLCQSVICVHTRVANGAGRYLGMLESMGLLVVRA